MAIVMVENAEVVVRTRDEHCPPHVHADCSPEGWSARFKFSFYSDDVEFWDLQPDYPKKPPSRARINKIGQAVFDNLTKIRGRWWEVMGTTCLINQYASIVNEKLILGGHKDAKQIGAASYSHVSHELNVIFKDGSTHRQNLESGE